LQVAEQKYVVTPLRVTCPAAFVGSIVIPQIGSFTFAGAVERWIAGGVGEGAGVGVGVAGGWTCGVSGGGGSGSSTGQATEVLGRSHGRVARGSAAVRVVASARRGAAFVAGFSAAPSAGFPCWAGPAHPTRRSRIIRRMVLADEPARLWVSSPTRIPIDDLVGLIRASSDFTID
jgi:hypothetical protein